MSKRLLLIPTAFEKKQIELSLNKLVGDFEKSAAKELSANELVIELCGFGPIASAVRTAQLIAEHRPDQVLLLGIAGAYKELEIGKAFQFSSIGCHGIGVGEGEDFQTAEQMGWSQSVNGVPVGNPVVLDENVGPQLLTACAASDNPIQAAQRLKLFPEACAEDMESYSVAMACLTRGADLVVVRGISNIAGERDKSKWEIELALESALELTREILFGKNNE